MAQRDDIEMNTCLRCGKELPLNRFRVDRRKPSGRISTCKKCDAKRAHKYRQENREQVLVQGMEHYRKNREVILPKMRKYKEDNHEKLAIYQRKYCKEYYRTDRGKATRARANFRRRSAFNINPQLTAIDWQKILDVYDNRCAYCGTRGDLEQDHIVPISRGGKHESGNVIPACQQCNSFKKAKLPNGLPITFRLAIENHPKLLGFADVSIIKQGYLYDPT